MRDHTRHEEMKAAFVEFHTRHPEVFQLFRRFTFDRINRGFQRYGASAIIARVRWETAGGNKPEDRPYKINNNHIPFYADLFRLTHPEHADFFAVRERTSKRARSKGIVRDEDI